MECNGLRRNAVLCSEAAQWEQGRTTRYYNDAAVTYELMSKQQLGAGGYPLLDGGAIDVVLGKGG